MTDIYMSYDNLKRTGQLRNVRVESGFGTVCFIEEKKNVTYIIVKFTIMMVW